MKAVILRQYGDVNELSYEEDDLPAVGAGEVRVRLHATSINPIDWKIRSGVMKEGFSPGPAGNPWRRSRGRGR